MAVKKHAAPYTLTDILGAPLSEQEAVSLVSKNTSPNTFRSFNIMKEVYRRKLLQFLMGKRGLSITYDTVFKHVMMPGGTTDGSIMNVEIQKIGYDFPGERASCYTADMIMRQYNYLKSRNQNFTYRDMKPVYLIVFMENSPSLFKSTSRYIHKKCSHFDTDIKLNLLENIIFISLDTFHSMIHNINTTQDAWLEFLTEDNPEKIVQFVNQFPEFLPCYQDLISFREKPEELIHMFSDALRELDKNTERYMVEELNKEVANLKEELNRQATALTEKTRELDRNTHRMQASDRHVTHLQEALAEKNLTISQQNSELSDMRLLIQSLTQKLEKYESTSENVSSSL